MSRFPGTLTVLHHAPYLVPAPLDARPLIRQGVAETAVVLAAFDAEPKPVHAGDPYHPSPYGGRHQPPLVEAEGRLWVEARLTDCSHLSFGTLLAPGDAIRLLSGGTGLDSNLFRFLAGTPLLRGQPATGLGRRLPRRHAGDLAPEAADAVRALFGRDIRTWGEIVYFPWEGGFRAIEPPVGPTARRLSSDVEWIFARDCLAHRRPDTVIVRNDRRGMLRALREAINPHLPVNHCGYVPFQRDDGHDRDVTATMNHLAVRTGVLAETARRLPPWSFDHPEVVRLSALGRIGAIPRERTADTLRFLAATARDLLRAVPEGERACKARAIRGYCDVALAMVPGLAFDPEAEASLAALAD